MSTTRRLFNVAPLAAAVLVAGFVVSPAAPASATSDDAPRAILTIDVELCPDATVGGAIFVGYDDFVDGHAPQQVTERLADQSGELWSSTELHQVDGDYFNVHSFPYEAAIPITNSSVFTYTVTITYEDGVTQSQSVSLAIAESYCGTGSTTTVPPTPTPPEPTTTPGEPTTPASEPRFYIGYTGDACHPPPGTSGFIEYWYQDTNDGHVPVEYHLQFVAGDAIVYDEPGPHGLPGEDGEGANWTIPSGEFGVAPLDATTTYTLVMWVKYDDGVVVSESVSNTAAICTGDWATTLPSTPASDVTAQPPANEPAAEIRVATFNASLNRAAEGGLVADLSTPDDAQAAAVAEIIQRARPDVLLLNEFDYDADGEAVELFATNYLEVAHNGADPIEYPYRFTAPVNTGVASGFDLDHDGTIGGANDAFGFGEFPGQYGMVLLSRYPIVDGQVRTFQQLLWSAMPDARLPDDPATAEPGDWYSPDELAALPLSSKSHWDVPIDIDGQIVHLLVSHPTPPTFDGDEDRNGLRNADEIAFWADYVAGDDTDWIIDDTGGIGGLAADAEFVIVGDLNADPVDGDSVDGAIQQLLDLDAVQDPQPTSDGGVEAAELQAGANATQQGDPAVDTADFADDPAPGNLRADYVLPSDGLRVAGSGVFWPPSDDPLAVLIAGDPPVSSDHRLVWVDLVPAPATPETTPIGATTEAPSSTPAG